MQKPCMWLGQVCLVGCDKEYISIYVCVYDTVSSGPSSPWYGIPLWTCGWVGCSWGGSSTELVLLPLRGTSTRGIPFRGRGPLTQDRGTCVCIHVFDTCWFTFPGLSYERDCWDPPRTVNHQHEPPNRVTWTTTPTIRNRSKSSC